MKGLTRFSQTIKVGLSFKVWRLRKANFGKKSFLVQRTIFLKSRCPYLAIYISLTQMIFKYILTWQQKWIKKKIGESLIQRAFTNTTAASLPLAPPPPQFPSTWYREGVGYPGLGISRISCSSSEFMKQTTIRWIVCMEIVSYVQHGNEQVLVKVSVLNPTINCAKTGQRR